MGVHGVSANRLPGDEDYAPSKAMPRREDRLLEHLAETMGDGARAFVQMLSNLSPLQILSPTCTNIVMDCMVKYPDDFFQQLFHEFPWVSYPSIFIPWKKRIIESQVFKGYNTVPVPT